jgi:hypothetical protein
MPKSVSTQLGKALREKLLVKFMRPFEPGTVNGYVLDIGPRFFLTVVLAGDCICFNGFQCFRLADVRRLQVPHKYAAFNEAALKKRRQKRPTDPHVSVASIQDLLRSANRAFPLLTIHRERPIQMCVTLVASWISALNRWLYLRSVQTPLGMRNQKLIGSTKLRA